jgi:hypothetical protein
LRHGAGRLAAVGSQLFQGKGIGDNPKNDGRSADRMANWFKPNKTAKIEDFTILVKCRADKISLKAPLTVPQNLGRAKHSMERW